MTTPPGVITMQSQVPVTLSSRRAAVRRSARMSCRRTEEQPGGSRAPKDRGAPGTRAARSIEGLTREDRGSARSIEGCPAWTEGRSEDRAAPGGRRGAPGGSRAPGRIEGRHGFAAASRAARGAWGARSRPPKLVIPRFHGRPVRRCVPSAVRAVCRGPVRRPPGLHPVGATASPGRPEPPGGLGGPVRGPPFYFNSRGRRAAETR